MDLFVEPSKGQENAIWLQLCHSHLSFFTIHKLLDSKQHSREEGLHIVDYIFLRLPAVHDVAGGALFEEEERRYRLESAVTKLRAVRILQNSFWGTFSVFVSFVNGGGCSILMDEMSVHVRSNWTMFT